MLITASTWLLTVPHGLCGLGGFTLPFLVGEPSSATLSPAEPPLTPE